MRSAKPYTYFSKLYTHLMQSVDYKFWAQYITEIHSTLGKKSDLALELSAGNCIIANYLNGTFKKIIATDISKEMLFEGNKDLQKVCCNMIHLPFKNKFDFIFSTFDSINYLNSDNKLKLFFNNINPYLKTNSYLTFDVSLKSNSIKHVNQLNRKGKFKGIIYNQKSTFNEKTKIHTNKITITLKGGEIFTETHIQKIYDFYYYFDVLNLTNFYVVECFDAFTFNDATENSDRVQFIVKRKN